jgi:hypothetical protein
MRAGFRFQVSGFRVESGLPLTPDTWHPTPAFPLTPDTWHLTPAKGDRITHRFEITSPGEIDGEVRKWLKTAYELDA